EVQASGSGKGVTSISCTAPSIPRGVPQLRVGVHVLCGGALRSGAEEPPLLTVLTVQTPSGAAGAAGADSATR
ncbi:MAG: hypothetical protein ACYS22_17530, partial [Planctomycetota bacterium]